MIMLAASVLIFLIVEAANGYESVTVFSPNFKQTSFLWYEHIFGPVLDVPPSWKCQGSVLQRGQGLIP
jgi:hypothetical protein